MNPTATVLRAGFTCGLIELRQSFTGAALFGQLLWPVVTLVAIVFLRDRNFGASGFTLGTLVLPGVLGMFVTLGMLLVVQYLSADREDGTLLRAKATPNGIRGYLIGKLVTVSGTILAYLTILLIPGLIIVGGLDIGSIRSWLTLGWVLLLGLMATIPIGAVLGSLISSPRHAGYISIPIMGLIAISGPSTRSPPSRSGCNGSPRTSRCTGSASACVRPCCRPARSASRSGSPGGIWKPSGCSGSGLCSAWSLRRSCWPGWRAGSRDRT
jgi:ABC-2 family transporter protein